MLVQNFDYRDAKRLMQTAERINQLKEHNIKHGYGDPKLEDAATLLETYALMQAANRLKRAAGERD